MKIIACGLNGAGKSTLGKVLAQKLGYVFLDIEDYYFPVTDEKYKYQNARSGEEVSELLLADMMKYDDLVLASVKGDYGEAEKLFTHAVYIDVPKEIRMRRIKKRSFQKFGVSMLENGDLYEREQRFFDMVSSRNDRYTLDWLESTDISVIYINGTADISVNAETVIKALEKK